MPPGVLVRLVTAQILLFGAMSGARMAFQLWLLRSGASAVVSSVVVASFGIAAALFLMHIAPRIERRGMLPTVGPCIVIMLLGFGLAIALPAFASLLVGGVLIGAGTNIATVALQRYAGATAPNVDALRRVFAWMSIGPAASAFVGPFFAGLMIDHAGASPGDATGFSAGFGLLALFSALTWFSLRGMTGGQPKPGAVQHRGSFRALLRMPGVGNLLLINTLVSMCWEAHNVVLPILGTERNFSASTIGAIMGALALAAAGVRLVTPVLLRHVHEHTVMRASIGLSMAVFAIYPFTTSAFFLGLAAVILGMTMGIIQPLLLTAMYQSVPDGRQSEVLGARIACVNTSSLVTPVLAGALSTVIGAAAVFWVTSALLATNFAPLRQLMRRRDGNAV